MEGMNDTLTTTGSQETEGFPLILPLPEAMTQGPEAWRFQLPSGLEPKQGKDSRASEGTAVLDGRKVADSFSDHPCSPQNAFESLLFDLYSALLNEHFPLILPLPGQVSLEALQEKEYSQ